MENIILNGSLHQQAIQLFELIKERELSPEQLDKIVPLAKGFVSEMSAVLKEQIQNDTANYQSVVKVYATVMESLASKYNENASPEVRREILQCISDISKELSSLEKKRQDKSTFLQSLWSVLCFIFIVIVLIVSAGKIQLNRETA